MKIKLEKSKEFRERMHQVDEKYQTTLQRAYYSNLSAIDTDIIKEVGIDASNRPVFAYYGDLQPKSQKLLDKLYLYLVKWLEERFSKRRSILEGDESTRGFNLVYFNTFCESSSHYEDFRGMVRTLPCRILLNLSNLIVVHPTLRVKTLDWIVIGTVNNEVKDRTHYVDSLYKCEKYGVQVDDAFLKKLREEVRDYDEPEKKGKKHKPQPVTHKKEDVEKILEKQEKKKSLQDYVRVQVTQQVSEIGVPVLLKTLVLYMKMNPDFLRQEGIFRRSVSIDEEKEAAAKLYSQDYDYLQGISNAYLVATLIKRFLTTLAEPLFPFDTYRRLAMINCEDPASISAVRSVVHSLPLLNYTTLMFLLKFFVEEVIPRQAQNKMSSYNSAVVLLPCVLWSEMKTLDDLTLGKNLAKVLELIIENFEYVFGDEKQQTKKYRESSRKSRKKFEKKLFEHNEEEERPRSRRQSQKERKQDIREPETGNKEVPKPTIDDKPHISSQSSSEHLPHAPNLPVYQDKSQSHESVDIKVHRQPAPQEDSLNIGSETHPQNIMQSKVHPHPLFDPRLD